MKSSTGYGLPRLVTGSLGSLGMIGEVTLKLWSRADARSRPSKSATPQRRSATCYRPLAVLETSEGSFVYLGGPEAQISEQSDSSWCGVA